MKCPSTICILMLKVLDSMVNGDVRIHRRLLLVLHHIVRLLFHWLLISVPRDISVIIICVIGVVREIISSRGSFPCTT